MGVYPRSRSDLGPAYARIAEASTSFPVPPEGPVALNAVSPQNTETDRDTCLAEGTHPNTLALLWPGKTVT